MKNLQNFVDKYRDLRYPHNKSTKELLKIFKRVGENYMNQSLMNDFINTQEKRNVNNYTKSSDFLDSLQRIININRRHNGWFNNFSNDRHKHWIY